MDPLILTLLTTTSRGRAGCTVYAMVVSPASLVVRSLLRKRIRPLALVPGESTGARPHAARRTLPHWAEPSGSHEDQLSSFLWHDGGFGPGVG